MKKALRIFYLESGLRTIPGMMILLAFLIFSLVVLTSLGATLTDRCINLNLPGIEVTEFCEPVENNRQNGN